MQGHERSLLVGIDPERDVIGEGMTALRMALHAYQRDSAKLARFPDKRTGPIIVFGLMGEAGEVLDSLAKYPFRSKEADAETLREIGDVLWYAAAICDEIGAKMADLPIEYGQAGVEPEIGKAPVEIQGGEQLDGVFIGHSAIMLSGVRHILYESVTAPMYWAIRIAIHAARVAEAMKKAQRDDFGVVSEARKAVVVAELGRVLACIKRAAEGLGSSLEATIAGNVAKLSEIAAKKTAEAVAQ